MSHEASGSLKFDSSALDELIELEDSAEDGLIASLIEDFRRELPKAMTAITSASSGFNYEELERVVHSLKSSSRTLGLIVTSEICKDMEDDAEKGQFRAERFQELQREVEIGLQKLTEFNSGRRAA